VPGRVGAWAGEGYSMDRGGLRRDVGGELWLYVLTVVICLLRRNYRSVRSVAVTTVGRNVTAE